MADLYPYIPIITRTIPIMIAAKVGVKTPGSGMALSVEGIEVRPTTVGVGLASSALEGVGVKVKIGVRVGEGVILGVIVAEGEAVKDGKSLVPAAKTVKALVSDCPFGRVILMV